ncbi:hypothetical protein N9089_04350, partial [Crocinitomicaceae bacterium]|nr:hypothetical protein [Crocinitomicaceae bacterium]
MNETEILKRVLVGVNTYNGMRRSAGRVKYSCSLIAIVLVFFSRISSVEFDSRQVFVENLESFTGYVTVLGPFIVSLLGVWYYLSQARLRRFGDVLRVTCEENAITLLPT